MIFNERIRKQNLKNTTAAILTLSDPTARRGRAESKIKRSLAPKFWGTCVRALLVLAVGAAVNNAKASTTTFSGSLDISDPSANFNFPGSRYDQYTYTAPYSGSYEFRTTPPGFDTVLYLFSDSFDPTNTATHRIGMNDDGAGNLNSLITANLTEGQTYAVVITNYGNNTGNYSITVTAPTPPQLDLTGSILQAGTNNRIFSNDILLSSDRSLDPNGYNIFLTGDIRSNNGKRLIILSSTNGGAVYYLGSLVNLPTIIDNGHLFKTNSYATNAYNLLTMNMGQGSLLSKIDFTGTSGVTIDDTQILGGKHTVQNTSGSAQELTINARNNNSFFGGNIAETANQISVIKNGPHSITFMGGSVAYTGPTTINAGLVRFINMLLPKTSNITINTTLPWVGFTLNSSTGDDIYEGSIEGHGFFQKNGASVLTLKGDLSNYSGKIQLYGGKLLADTTNGGLGTGEIRFEGGILETRVNLNNPITLYQNSTLRVGSTGLSLTGLIRPNNHTLTILGNDIAYGGTTLTAGSTYDFVPEVIFNETIAPGSTFSLGNSFGNLYNNNLLYRNISYQNPGIAGIDDQGVITALSAGTDILTCTASKGTFSIHCKVYLTVT